MLGVSNFHRKHCTFLSLICFSLITHSGAAFGELKGTKLRCCYILEYPYVFSDRTNVAHSNVSGLAISYLGLLQDRLGFTCDSLVEYASDDVKYKGFSGFVNAMHDCAVDGDSSNCICDMGVGAWAVSSMRYLKVDYVSPLSADRFRVVTRTSSVREANAKNVFFIQAFSLQVWGAIASLAVLHMFVTLFDRNFARPPRDCFRNWEELSFWQRQRHLLMKTKLLYRIRRAFFNTTLNFIGQTSNDRSPKTGTKQTVMNLVGLLFGVFLLTIYQASVTLQVLVEIPVSPFASINDFKSCKIEADRVCIAGNGAAENFWNEAIATEPCMKEVKKQPKIVSSFAAGFEKVLDESCDYFYTLEGHVVSQTKGRYCGRLTAVGKPFFDTSVGFILPMDSNLTKIMSEQTLILREADKLETSTNFADRLSCNEVTDPTITWSKLRVFFYMAYAGLGVILVFMVFDMFIDGRNNAAPDTSSAQKNSKNLDSCDPQDLSHVSPPRSLEQPSVSGIAPDPARTCTD